MNSASEATKLCETKNLTVVKQHLLQMSSALQQGIAAKYDRSFAAFFEHMDNFLDKGRAKDHRESVSQACTELHKCSPISKPLLKKVLGSTGKDMETSIEVIKEFALKLGSAVDSIVNLDTALVANDSSTPAVVEKMLFSNPLQELVAMLKQDPGRSGDAALDMQSVASKLMPKFCAGINKLKETVIAGVTYLMSNSTSTYKDVCLATIQPGKSSSVIFSPLKRMDSKDPALLETQDADCNPAVDDAKFDFGAVLSSFGDLLQATNVPLGSESSGSINFACSCFAGEIAGYIKHVRHIKHGTAVVQSAPCKADLIKEVLAVQKARQAGLTPPSVKPCKVELAANVLSAGDGLKDAVACLHGMHPSTVGFLANFYLF